MPRPKIPGTETIQTFNCSYTLKAGLFRSAEVAKLSNPSSLIRAELEESCRRLLGDAEWKELVRAGQDPARMEKLERLITKWDTQRLRTILKSKEQGKSSDNSQTAQLLAAIESYWRDLITDRDRADLPLSLRVTLFEAADVVYKLMRPFRADRSPKALQAMLVLCRKLPSSLRADIEAAIVRTPNHKEQKA